MAQFIRYVDVLLQSYSTSRHLFKLIERPPDELRNVTNLDQELGLGASVYEFNQLHEHLFNQTCLVDVVFKGILKSHELLVLHLVHAKPISVRFQQLTFRSESRTHTSSH